MGLLSLALASCGGQIGGTGGTGSPEVTISACGGTTPLTFNAAPASPGDPCGPCSDGALICASPNLLACVGALPASACPDASTTSDAEPLDATDDGYDGYYAGFFGQGVDASSDATTTPDVSTPDVSSPYDAGPFDAGPGWQPFTSAVDDAGNVLYPEPDGGGAGAECLDIVNNDMVLDPVRGVLYATVPDAQSFGNSVVQIDPSTATVAQVVYVGSNPNALGISDDAASLYVGVDGASSVVRVGLATGSLDPPVYLGAGEFGGARTAGSILAVPGSTTRYVVSLRNPDVDPSFAGLVVYDGATVLGQWSNSVGGESMTFLGASTLYGFNNETSGYDLFEFSVGAGGGVGVVADAMGLFTGYETAIEGQGDWLFGTSGQTVDGTTLQPVGTYPAAGPVWPDPDGTEVWFLSSPESNFTDPTAPTALVDCDRASFLASRTVLLPTQTLNYLSMATRLVRWSPTGFAFRTASQVCIVNVPP